MLPFEFARCVHEAEVLIIVPPFAALDRPALGPHILQASARAVGTEVAVLYANILLANELGEMNYVAISKAPSALLVGERFFAATAYEGASPAGTLAIDSADLLLRRSPQNFHFPIGVEDLQRLALAAEQWADELATALSQLDFKIVGCSTTFQQTTASVALLRRIKRLRPNVITIIGGANCEGEMAEGIRSLQSGIDYVFSGECETVFPKFLTDIRSGHLPVQPVIHGAACQNLDQVPTPVFTEYYQQLQQWLPEREFATDANLWLTYETSRGCWWGQKHHCTFCGLNGQGMAFRAKSPNRVIEELKALLAQHPSKYVCMSDNIMPYSYFRALLPRLGKELPGLHVFYEEKANLSLANVVALKEAGVCTVQAGIEALSSSLLRRMDKGVSPRQNIDLLRYARAVDLHVSWNLLYGFPGDQLCDYEQTLQLLPLLSHLQPPSGFYPLIIDRFSPYFNEPAKYGIRDLRPWESYASAFPEHADLGRLAYHFDGDYGSASRNNADLIARVSSRIEEWRHQWQPASLPPLLTITPLTDDYFMLLDTRRLPGTKEISFVTRRQAACACAHTDTWTEEVDWALRHKLVVEMDARFVPLATAAPELLQWFEAEARGGERGASKPVLAANSVLCEDNAN